MVAACAVSPWIVSADADALLAFLSEVLGAQEIGRAPGPGDRVGHAETRIGDTAVVVMDAHEGWSPQPSLLRVDVTDLAGVVDRAVAAGATLVTGRTSLPVGDDVARFTDPWGNLWWVQEHTEDLDVSEMVRRMSDPTTVEVVAAYEASLDTEMRRRSDRQVVGARTESRKATWAATDVSKTSPR